MSVRKRRLNDNISTDLKYNIEKLINPESILTDYSDYVIIWLDKSVNNDQSDNQYSYHRLGHVTDSIAIFTDENKCFDFINKFRANEKQLFLIVSGSLGEHFVPIVNDLSYINSIYVFCAIKSRHEIWTKNYNKIKAVSDDIDDLCKYLKTDKEKYQENQIITHTVLKPASKKFLLPYEFDVIVDLSENRYDSDQPNDDIQTSTESAEIPFGIEENRPLKSHIEIQDQVESSETVTPYTHRNQQMEFSDTGIWPHLLVIANTPNQLSNHLNSVLGITQNSQSIDNCLQHIHSHQEDPHLVVLSDSMDIAHISRLIPLVSRLYIYCPNTHAEEYRAWIEAYSNIVSVLRQINTLTRLIIWDLSISIIEIGNSYDNQNQNNLAQTRFRYAYHLQIMIREDLNSLIDINR
ncbi:unnamed protein product [Rotaria magnacalcarata]|uniref:Uncharacterized protein n=1 Tax=Rotaria magnacalcarata TaxID=392030 RepID=A0A819RCP5_9BILA|nr:unnamed protein product [Rotaria magnacalcarata]CAF4042369.1 unnamed protein product [Rotaria magnacalcarata]